MTDAALWREQYYRMGRWYQRLWLNVEHIVGGGDDAPLDVFYAFAQACYHLVDWLENDHSQHVRRGHAEAYVASRPVLAYCRDICNGSKHAQLQAKNVEVRKQKEVTSHSITDESGQTHEYKVDHIELSVRWGDQFVDVETFARQCIEEWNDFLRSEGLVASQ